MSVEGAPPTLLAFEGESRLPSLVVLDGEGKLRVGKVARNQLLRDPARGERTPKRHLGASERLAIGVPVVDAVAAVLARVAEEGRYRNNGAGPARVVLTHPVRWREDRLAVFRKAAEAAGLPDPDLVPEPVAAALHYVHTRGTVLPGAHVAVYDLGAGTYDTAVLRATGSGFEVAGPPGGDPNLGGERFDDALLAHVGEAIAARDPDLWARLTEPESRSERIEALELRVAVREAKEELSTETSSEIHVRALDESIRVTRPDFERLITDALSETMDELERAIAAAGLQPGDLTALYLTGDSSRIPAVFAAVHRRFAPLTPDRLDDPKAVVALGALRHLELKAEAERRLRDQQETERQRQAEEVARKQAEEQQWLRKRQEEDRRRQAEEAARKRAEDQDRWRKAQNEAVRQRNWRGTFVLEANGRVSRARQFLPYESGDIRNSFVDYLQKHNYDLSNCRALNAGYSLEFVSRTRVDQINSIYGLVRAFRETRSRISTFEEDIEKVLVELSDEPMGTDVHVTVTMLTERGKDEHFLFQEYIWGAFFE
jgi:actin-like ATPase involved in cell morphogenesis